MRYYSSTILIKISDWLSSRSGKFEPLQKHSFFSSSATMYWKEENKFESKRLKYIRLPKTRNAFFYIYSNGLEENDE